MSQYILKNITLTLDPKSIDNAIKEIKQFKEDLEDGLSELARRLTEHGVTIAKMYVARFDAIDTGTLADSINGEYDKESHTGTVQTDLYYAVYVEFGTGIIGENVPHPMQAELGITYPAAQKYGYGGWWYPSVKGWYQPPNGGPLMAWTNGMESRPFMYSTLRELERVAEASGGRIIAEYIP